MKKVFSNCILRGNTVLKTKKALICIILLTIIGQIRGQEKVAIEPFRSLAHGLGSGPVFILDEKQIEIEKLKYDGKGPAAYFAVGSKGNVKQEYPGAEFMDNIIIIPDENGSCVKPKRYDGSKSVTLTLPGKLTFRDIRYLMVHCIRFHHNFGYVEIPQPLTLRKAANTTGPFPCSKGMELTAGCPKSYYYFIVPFYFLTASLLSATSLLCEVTV